MTTPSSNKNTFMIYFLYRMRHQIKFLIVTFMLNVLSLGLFSVNTLIGIKSEYEAFLSNKPAALPELRVLTGGLVMISALAVLVMVIFGAVSAFDYCLKSERTDTYYGLPVTLRGRFWADFTSGYISHVAALIPCSVFSMIVSIPADGWFSKLALEKTGTYQSGIIIKAFAELSLSLFFTYTFAYLLSVIVTVCCGRVRSSVTFTAVSSIILMITGCAVSGFVTLCRIGVGDFEYVIFSLKNVPPLGTFFGKVKSTLDLINNINSDGSDPTFGDPVIYIIYTLIAVTLIAAAYFIFKRRRPENTGRQIAVKGFYFAFSCIVAFTLICLCCYITYSLHKWWLSALIAAVAAGIALLIFTAAGKPPKTDIKKSLIRSFAVIACSIALLVIFDKTGAFGTRYYNISSEKTESIDIIINDYSQGYSREVLKLEDKADIEKFIDLHNDSLKKSSDKLTYGSGFIVTYNLTNGKTIERKYYSGSLYVQGDVLNELFNNVRSLPNYPKLSSVSVSEEIYKSTRAKAIMYDKFGSITIPEDYFAEFANILSCDIREKYDNNAQPAGYVSIDRNQQFRILSTYTDTISFIESFREYDENADAYYVSVYGNPYIGLHVKMKNVNDDLEKELFSLFKQATSDSDVTQIHIFSSNGLRYYVPEENKERVIDLVMTIIEKNCTQ